MVPITRDWMDIVFPSPKFTAMILKLEFVVESPEELIKHGVSDSVVLG